MLAGGALENLRRWAVEGVAPPRAPRIELLTEADGGPHGEIRGSMTPFPPDKLRKLYGTPAAYRAAYAQRTRELVAGHWILPGDADRMLAAAAEVAFDPLARGCRSLRLDVHSA